MQIEKVESAEKPESVEQERYDRERSFHNQVFIEKGRAPVKKYYSIADVSDNYYRDSILARGAQDILEIGCGRGSVASFLARDVSFTAIDISDVAVQETAEVARDNGITGSYLLMNAEETGFADNSFDLICGTGILHHLNLEKACGEIRRILRPNGCAVFLEPLGHNPLINMFRRMTPQFRTVDEHPLLMKDLRDMRSHLDQVNIRYFCLLSLAAVPFRSWRVFPAMKNTLEWVDTSLFRTLPASGRYAWQMVMTMSGPKAEVR
jgi:SAM-dependent methyltransferase